MVPANLADLHGDRRDAAITEATRLSYVFAIAAPLITSLAISVTLGWRAAVLAGAAMAGVLLLCFGRLAVIEPSPHATAQRAPLRSPSASPSTPLANSRRRQTPAS
jgi:hypothetical protein